MKRNKKIEIVGMVLAVEYSDKDGKLLTPDREDVLMDFEGQGFEVQEVSLGIDGFYRVEVLA